VESQELYMPRRESPKVRAWLDLLHHLSAQDSNLN
jgi:hypothetical protein